MRSWLLGAWVLTMASTGSAGPTADVLRERSVADVDRWLRAMCQQSWTCEYPLVKGGSRGCYTDAELLCNEIQGTPGRIRVPFGGIG